jgi:DNA gyrase subunit B
MKPYVAEVVQRGLDKWSKERPNDLNKIAGYLKDIAQVRQKTEEGKVKLAKSYTKSAFSGLPDKYVKPTGNKDLELWIVEGDSAGGTAKSARVNASQGVFPIRGKIPNAFEKSKADILSNAECRGILDIIGGGDPGKNWGKDFDISRVKWSKIVGCPDADPDGSHINALLLRFFIIYATPLLENGMYYKAVSPLYGIKTGKKYNYFINRIDMLKHFQKQFTAKNKVTCPDGSPLSGTKLTSILLEFADYTWEVNRIARTYKVDPYMLEKTLMLHKQGKNIKAITKEVKKDYQYITGSTILGTPTIEGLIGTKYNTIFLNDKFLNESKTILEYMSSNTPLVYKLDGKPITMYGLMTKFDEMSNATISRYKGLGELETQQFRESVMDPSYNRTFIQYTLDSAMEEIEAIRAYESNKAKILDHISNISRTDLME